MSNVTPPVRQTPPALDATRSFLSLCIAALVGWWIYHETEVIHSRMVWFVIAVLCFFSATGLAAAVMRALQPKRIAPKATSPRSCADMVNTTCMFGGVLVYMTRDVAEWPWVAGGALILLAIAIVRSARVRFPTVKPAPRPMKPSSAQLLTSTSSEAPRWHVFLSYSSRNSNEVRRFAESLQRQGYTPWFAEHEISPHEWNQPETIAQRLAEGVSGCRYFLVFTNDEWAGSNWCNEEMRAILARAAQLERAGVISSPSDAVAEVRLPPTSAPHVRFPDLANVRHCVVQHDSLEVWDFLERTLRWPIIRRANEEVLIRTEQLLPGTPAASLPGGLSFTLGGLEEHEDVFDPGYRSSGWEYSKYSGAWIGQQLHLRVLVNPFRGRLGLPSGVPDVSDDRALHRQYVASFSEQLRGDDSVVPLGTHLVHLSDGHAGIAVSLLRTENSTVSRIYVLPLQREQVCRGCGKPLMFSEPADKRLSGELIASCQNADCSYAELWPRWEQDTVGEIEFAFLFDAKEANARSARMQLGVLAPLMDATALSIRTKLTARLVEWQTVLFRLVVIAAAFEGFRYCRIALSPVWLQGLWLMAIGFACAEMLFALALPSERRDMMRARYGSKMKLPFGTWFPRLWNIGKGGILQSAYLAFLGSLPMGAVALIATYYANPDMLALLPPLGASIAVAGMSSRLHFELSQAKSDDSGARETAP